MTLMSARMTASVIGSRVAACESAEIPGGFHAGPKPAMLAPGDPTRGARCKNRRRLAEASNHCSATPLLPLLPILRR